ncbi:filament-like plant protein isoform X2 [Morus notabilis]|nr:filament-like plant protein isoform X2 [Morus notabilis]
MKSEDVNNSMKCLTEKLSAALVNVSAKEDLVKQHAKVAEEAVAGWEKAENEVATLKQQLEVAVQQKSALEDRASHLDGALKECVRQLRQARDEQEQKIQEAVSKKSREWESTKCKLENQLLELQNKAQSEKAESSARIDPDLCLKLEYLEKENSALRLEIEAQMEELEVRTIERDLSTQAAEMASKQHLEGIKKVAKLEAECRRFKAMAYKSSTGYDNKSTAASSIYVESFTDSHSDNGERLNAVDANMHKMNSLELNKCEQNLSDSWASALIAELDQFKNEKAFNKSLPNSSIEINLMDDFLEMEQLAALQPTESRCSCLEPEIVARDSKNRESALRAELEAMVQRTAELEEKLEKLERERAELEAKEPNDRESVLRAELEDRIHQITNLEGKLEKLESEKAELEDQETALKTELEARIHQTTELEDKLEKLETEKAEVEYVDSILRTELEARIHRIDQLEEKLTKLETEVDESRNGESVLKTELEAMFHQKSELEEKLRKLEIEKAESINGESALRSEREAMIHQTAELEDKLKMLETEKAESRNGESVLRTDLDAMIYRTAELEEKLEKLETEKVESTNGESVLRTELEGMIHRTAELEAKLEKLEAEKVEARNGESAFRAELEAMIHRTAELEEKLEKLEMEKAKLEAVTKSECNEASQLKLMEAEMKLEVLKRELEIAKESKLTVESQLVSLEAEVLTMSAKVNHLEEDIQRERALSAEISMKCRELEEELSREREEVKLRQNAGSNGELKIKQEDIAVAAGKLAECQKTIASLGNQLKSLATLEDFLIDAANLPEFSAASSLVPRTGEQWKLHSNQTFSPKRDSNPSKKDNDSCTTSLKQNQENCSPPSSSSSSSSTSAMVLSTHVSSEKNRNGFAKFFSRTKSGIRLEI